MAEKRATETAEPRATTSTTTYILVYVGLLLLLAATVGATFIDLGSFNIVITLGIAATKALLVVLYFMHVRESSRLTWVFVASAYVWLGILFVLGFSDYITRGTFPLIGQ